jgi:magnesium-transporting ATPase (P-type)
LIRFGHSDPKVDMSNQTGQVQVRIISGDHIDTCKYVAEKCGILNPNDTVNRVMTGEQFRDAIG